MTAYVLSPGDTASVAPCPPPPPSSSSIATLDGSATSAQLLKLAADPTVAEIRLVGDFNWPWFEFLVNRAVLVDATAATFHGQGAATWYGQFDLARSAACSGLTWRGGLFTGFQLYQAGIITIRTKGTSNVALEDLRFDPAQVMTTTGPGGESASASYKSWAVYLTGNMSGVAVRRVLVRGTNRNWSGLQLDSSTIQNGAVTLEDIVGWDLDYALYAGVPSSPLTVRRWSLFNCGHTSSGSSVRFLAGTGSYGDMRLAGSLPVKVDGGSFTNAGNVVVT